jgi:TfoX/Sxy family transcriptional regulator of competence genes
MKMPGQDAASLELLRESLGNLKIPAEKKKMFGHETYFLKGYMFSGVYDSDIFVHVGIEKVETSQGMGVGFFEPMGKRMRSYLTLPKSMQNPENLKSWLMSGAAYLSSLPTKKSPKAPAKSKAKPKTSIKKVIKPKPKKKVSKAKKQIKRK